MKEFVPDASREIVVNNREIWLSQICSLEYSQIIYPQLILSYLVGQPTLDYEDILIKKSPEHYPPKYKEEVKLEEARPHVIHGVQSALHPFQSVGVK